jgi:hypothetical protein
MMVFLHWCRVESTKKVVSSTKEPVSSTMELVSSSNREPVSMTEGSTHEIREPSFYKALFLPGGLPDDTEVGYYVKGQVSDNGFFFPRFYVLLSCTKKESIVSKGGKRKTSSLLG